MSDEPRLQARDLVRELDHPRPEVRLQAANRLVELGPDAEFALVEALQKSRDVRVRRRVLLILKEIDVPKAIPALMAYVLDRPSLSADDTRALAMRAIMTSLRPKHRKHCFDVFVELRRDGDPMVRSIALEGLAKLGDPRAKPFLEEASRNEEEDFVRENAGRLLATFVPVALEDQGEDTVYTDQQLVHKLASPDAWQRDMGIQGLLERDNPFQHFVDAIRSPHKLARQSGIRGLGSLGDPRGFDILFKLVENPDVNADERAYALRAMARIGVPDDKNTERMLRSLERWVRNQSEVFVAAGALAVIATLDHPDALDMVSRRLRHSEPWIREVSAQALAETAQPRHRSLLPELKDALTASGKRAQEVHDATGEWPVQEFALQRYLLTAINRVADNGPGELDLVATVVRYLGHPRDEIRREAEKFLETVAHRPGDLTEVDLKVVLEQLSSRSPGTRDRALSLLERTLPRGAAFAAPRLASLTYHNDPALLKRLIPLLGRCQDHEAEKALARLSRDPRKEVADPASEELLSNMSGPLQ